MDTFRIILVVTTLLRIATQHTDDAATHGLADQKLSAGQMALAIRQGGSPRLVETLRRGLKDESSVIRAAAGRIINASRASVPFEEIRSALLVETDLEAAREEAGALVTRGGAQAAATLQEAGSRLGGRMPGVMALLLARTRGVADIEAYVSELKAISLSPAQRASCILMATRHDAAALNSVGKYALGANDIEAWIAVLDGALEAAVELEENLLLTALRHSRQDVAGESAWRLAKEYSIWPPRDPTGIRAALQSADIPVNGAADADLLFGMELLARVLGREPIDNRGWTEHVLASGSTRMALSEFEGPLAGMLTAGERRAFEVRRPKDRGDLPAPRPLREREPLPKNQPRVRLASGFPPGFVSETLIAAGCRLKKTPLVAEANVTYDEVGRPRSLALVRAPRDSECARAVTALFAASVAPMGKVADPTKSETLILILEKGYLSRLENSLTQAEVSCLSCTGREKLEPPSRTLFVRPEYPGEARTGRHEGKVILAIVVNESGHVSDMQLLKGAAPAFARAGFLSVAQWRYKPALRDGKPISVNLTVIIEWNLR